MGEGLIGGPSENGWAICDRIGREWVSRFSSHCARRLTRSSKESDQIPPVSPPACPGKKRVISSTPTERTVEGIRTGNGEGSRLWRSPCRLLARVAYDGPLEVLSCAHFHGVWEFVWFPSRCVRPLQAGPLSQSNDGLSPSSQSIHAQPTRPPLASWATSE
jgi:hypothetical protein